ncbi:MAG: hypothetical protein Q7R50_04500 [Dehalococcoidales bacterium]|nr:hypothetical protein [Dehalococcoidales bacterium]
MRRVKCSEWMKATTEPRLFVNAVRGDPVELRHLVGQAFCLSILD